MLHTLYNAEITVKGWKQTESIYPEMEKTEFGGKIWKWNLEKNKTVGLLPSQKKNNDNNSSGSQQNLFVSTYSKLNTTKGT